MPPQVQPNKRFENHVVAVTGSARGIGKNIARAFAGEGAQVIVCDIDEDAGNVTVSELSGAGYRADYFPVDLSQQGAPQGMVKDVARQFGGLHVLVNNARSGQRVGLLEQDEANWEDGLSVTLRAAFFASQEAVRLMARSEGGSIVNIGSIAGLFVCDESPVYHIAKAGMIQMTRYFAAHAGQHGVRVNCVVPAFIVQDEHMDRYAARGNAQYRDTAEFSHPLGEVGRSDDVANAVMFLASREASFITGRYLVLDGGLTVQDQSNLLYRFRP